MELTLIQKMQKDLMERMETTPMVPSVKDPEKGDPDDYKSLVGKLKTLHDIENDMADNEIRKDELALRREELAVRLQEAQLRHDADMYKADVDNAKSKRDTVVKIGTTAAGIGAGYGAILLTGLLESDRLIRSKAWQFGSKMLAKFV